MGGRETNWEKAIRAARRIRDADYSCGDFFEDLIAAFPELRLYVLDSVGGVATTTSGRSQDDEYQRTMGAFFALYWLMRLDSDGAQAFCHGVGADWDTLSKDSDWPIRDKDEVAKRENFLRSGNWNMFSEVLVHAGLLDGKGKHDPVRTLAMLSLTAIHDIMKNQDLLPCVEEQEEFRGYGHGEVINDHDVALAYVLEKSPSLLPSFAGLPKAQKESVKFTQCKMEYNMGWLVQAEAPPGALFRKFRSVVQAGHAAAADIAFYFVHWLTDLAGAEPFPLEGCEKFVLKFPQPVLKSFLDSFPVVRQLDSMTETEIFEKYLVWRWTSHKPDLGPVPEGRGSIARMRLMIMAQLAGTYALEGYETLFAEDRHVLDDELARTGISGQQYVRDPGSKLGPSFLIYYSPAFLQKNAATDPQASLEVLAELFRQARALWPESKSQANDTVTLRIDTLKDLDIHAMNRLNPGEFWALQKSTGVDGLVKKASVAGADWHTMRVLNFSLRRALIAATDGEGSMEMSPRLFPPAAKTKLVTESEDPQCDADIVRQPPTWVVCCLKPRVAGRV